MSHQAKPKYTKRLIPTAQKQQQKRDAKAAEQTDNRGDDGRVSRRSTGERITFGNALADIRRALEKHPGAHSLAEVSDFVGIDLQHPECQPLLRMIENAGSNARTKLTRTAAAELRLEYVPFLGIYNRQKLEEALRRESVCGIRLSDFERETYHKVADDVQALVDAEQVVALPRPELARKILFWVPEGVPASDVARRAWSAVRVPEGDELQSKLVDLKARTSAQMGARKRRQATERERQAELQKKPKKRRRVVQSRNRTNTHLPDPNARA